MEEITKTNGQRKVVDYLEEDRKRFNIVRLAYVLRKQSQQQRFIFLGWALCCAIVSLAYILFSKEYHFAFKSAWYACGIFSFSYLVILRWTARKADDKMGEILSDDLDAVHNIRSGENGGVTGYLKRDQFRSFHSHEDDTGIEVRLLRWCGLPEYSRSQLMIYLGHLYGIFTITLAFILFALGVIPAYPEDIWWCEAGIAVISVFVIFSGFSFLISVKDMGSAFNWLRDIFGGSTVVTVGGQTIQGDARPVGDLIKPIPARRRADVGCCDEKMRGVREFVKCAIFSRQKYNEHATTLAPRLDYLISRLLSVIDINTWELSRVSEFLDREIDDLLQKLAAGEDLTIAPTEHRDG